MMSWNNITPSEIFFGEFVGADGNIYKLLDNNLEKKNMNIIEALQALKDEKKVRRSGWGEEYLKIGRDGLIYGSSGEKFVLSVTDIDGWELYEEPKDWGNSPFHSSNNSDRINRVFQRIKNEEVVRTFDKINKKELPEEESEIIKESSKIIHSFTEDSAAEYLVQSNIELDERIGKLESRTNYISIKQDYICEKLDALERKPEEESK